MAKTIGFQRSTSQVVTIDTINNLVAPLGPALTGSIPTTSTGFPAKLQNTNAVFRGDPYTIVVTGAGNIEIRKYDALTNSWSLSSPSFAPLFGGSQMPVCLEVDNDELVAIWINSAGTATRASAAFYDGTTWSPRIDSQLTPAERLTLTGVSGTISPGDAMAQGLSTGVVLSFDIGSGTLILNLTSTTPFTTGAISDTTSAATGTVTASTSVLDGNTGGNSTVWHRAVWFATKAGLAHFFPGRITFSSAVVSPRFAVGETVTGGSSGAIGVIRLLGTQGLSPTQYFIDVTPSSGSFTVGEVITGSSNLQTVNITTPIGTFSVGDTVTATGGVSGTIREIIGSPTPTAFIVALISGVFPGAGTINDTSSGASATITGSSAIYFASATVGSYCFGSIDTGDDPSISDPLLDNIVTQGCFSFWNNDLYFAKPDTGAGIRLYKLTTTWDSPAPAPPQWDYVTGVTGLTTSGTMTNGPDVGNYCLFVNKLDELCLLHSGPSGTRLTKASKQSFPDFTDVTVDKLPVGLSSRINLGISCYIDNRRRLNELQWFFFRDSSVLNNDTTMAIWDGVGSVEVLALFSGSDFLLPAGRNGEIRTFTNLQPGCAIVSVNTTMPPAFPGRAVINYILRDTFSRNMDVFGEYSVDGDTWFPMTEGAGDDGAQALASSPSGTSHTFFWDAFADLDGDYTFMNLRIIARISVATNETPQNQFVAVIQEGYLRPPVTRNQSQYRLLATQGTGLYLTGDTVSGATSGATGTSHYAGIMCLLTTTPTGAINVGDAMAIGSATGTVEAVETTNSLKLVLASGAGFAVGDTVTDTVSGATGQILGMSGVTAYIYILTGSWTTPSGSIKDLASLTTTTYSSAVINPAVVVNRSTGTFAAGTFSDTITGSTATASVVDLTETVFSSVGSFELGEVINDNRTRVLTLTSTVGFNVGDTVVAGVATGTIALVNTPTITVIVGSGSFIPGPINDTTSLASALITAVNQSTATVRGITPDVITSETIAADETTDIEEFHQVSSISTRSHAQLVFQGRLSTNQTKIRFLKMVVRGSGTTPRMKISVFVSGSGPNNQYTGLFSTFQTLPASDLEVVINATDLMTQPSASGKRYSIVIEFDLAFGESGVVSTPFFRHE